AYEVVASLTDRVGQRLAGTEAAERAVAWALEAMRTAGLENVRAEPVKVPCWIRGEAAIEVTAPVARPLHAVALGGSVGWKGAGAEGGRQAHPAAGGRAVRVARAAGRGKGGGGAVGQVLGRVARGERPEEIVLLGAHLDSWDLGDGAIDDGAGVAVVLETARL